MSSNLLASDVTPLTRLEGQSRRKLSLTIGFILLFLAASFYAVTLVRLKGNVAKRFNGAPKSISTKIDGAVMQKTPAAPIPKQGN